MHTHNDETMNVVYRILIEKKGENGTNREVFKHVIEALDALFGKLKVEVEKRARKCGCRFCYFVQSEPGMMVGLVRGGKHGVLLRGSSLEFPVMATR